MISILTHMIFEMIDMWNLGWCCYFQFLILRTLGTRGQDLGIIAEEGHCSWTWQPFYYVPDCINQYLHRGVPQIKHHSRLYPC